MEKLKKLREELLIEINNIYDNTKNEEEKQELSDFVASLVGELPNSLIVFNNYFTREHIRDFADAEITDEQITEIMENMYIDYDTASRDMRDYVKEYIEDNLKEEDAEEENNNEKEE